MNVLKDFLPRVKVQETRDETLSYSGKSDFTREEPEIKTLGSTRRADRPRTKASVNNSYT